MQFQYTTGQTGKSQGSQQPLQHGVTPLVWGEGAGSLRDEGRRGLGGGETHTAEASPQGKEHLHPQPSSGSEP